eukprot:tig00021616_g22914.t1
MKNTGWASKQIAVSMSEERKILSARNTGALRGKALGSENVLSALGAQRKESRPSSPGAQLTSSIAAAYFAEKPGAAAKSHIAVPLPGDGAPKNGLNLGPKPSSEDVRDFGVYIGLNPERDTRWLWVAEVGINEPLPDGWSQHFTEEGQVYYYNALEDKSAFEHPHDRYYRFLVTFLKKYEREIRAHLLGVDPNGALVQPAGEGYVSVAEARKMADRARADAEEAALKRMKASVEGDREKEAIGYLIAADAARREEEARSRIAREKAELAIREVVERARREQGEAIRAEAEKASNTRLATVRAEYEERIGRLKAEYEERIGKMRGEFETKLEAERTGHARQLKRESEAIEARARFEQQQQAERMRGKEMEVYVAAFEALKERCRTLEIEVEKVRAEERQTLAAECERVRVETEAAVRRELLEKTSLLAREYQELVDRAMMEKGRRGGGGGLGAPGGGRGHGFPPGLVLGAEGAGKENGARSARRPGSDGGPSEEEPGYGGRWEAEGGADAWATPRRGIEMRRLGVKSGWRGANTKATSK